jgi:hypothetical protein
VSDASDDCDGDGVRSSALAPCWGVGDEQRLSREAQRNGEGDRHKKFPLDRGEPLVGASKSHRSSDDRPSGVKVRI